MDTPALAHTSHVGPGKGLYLVRGEEGDIATYVLRMKTPNQGDYLSPGGMHTLEHLLLQYMFHSQWGAGLIHVGPLGCRTAFCLIVQGLALAAVIRLVQDSFFYILHYTGPVPLADEETCGHCLDQELSEARAVAADLCLVLEGWTQEMLRS